MSKAVEGILFDLDNTILDWSGAGDWEYSERKHLELVHSFLADNERPLTCSVNHFAMVFRDKAMDAWEESRTTLRAPHMLKIMEMVLAEFGFIPDESLSIEIIMKAYDWGAEEGVTTFPDVPAVLEQLLNDNIKLGIVTNAWQPMWMRDAELKHHKLLRYFLDKKTRISAADVGYLKPHPQIFDYALKQIGTKPENTLFVGDNPVADIAGAQNAGMRAVLRVNHPAPPLISGLVVPDAAINDLSELLLLVEDWDKYATSL